MKVSLNDYFTLSMRNPWYNSVCSQNSIKLCQFFISFNWWLTKNSLYWNKVKCEIYWQTSSQMWSVSVTIGLEFYFDFDVDLIELKFYHIHHNKIIISFFKREVFFWVASQRKQHDKVVPKRLRVHNGLVSMLL